MQEPEAQALTLDPALKALWLAALRSGAYRQTQQKLFDGFGYCCLGVLARVMGAEFVHGYHGFDPVVDGSCLRHGRLGGGSEYLDETRCGIPLSAQTTLGSMNDTMGKSFVEIADYVEQRL